MFNSTPDQDIVLQLRAEVEALRRQLRYSAPTEAESGPTIYVITPTYARPVQIG